MPSFGGLWSDRRSSDSNMLQKGGSFHRAPRSVQNVGHRQKRSSCYVGGDSSVKTNSTTATALTTAHDTSPSSLTSKNLNSAVENGRKARIKRSNANSSEGLAASTAATFAAVAAIRESSGDISGAVSEMKVVAELAPASESFADGSNAEKKSKSDKYSKYKHENKKLKKELESLREELQLLDKLKTENLQLNMLLESMDQGNKVASHDEGREKEKNFEDGNCSLLDSIYGGQKVATHDGRTEEKRSSEVGNDSSSNCENNSSEVSVPSSHTVEQKEKDDNFSQASKNSKGSKTSAEEIKKSTSAAASTSSTHTSKRERRLQSQVKHLATLISQQHEAHKNELKEMLAKQEHDLTVLHKKQLQDEIQKMQVRQMTQLEQQQQFYESREKEREAKKGKMEQQPTATARDQSTGKNQTNIEDTKEFQDLLDKRLQEAIDEALCKSEAEIMFFHNNELESLRCELQQSREVARREHERAEELVREKKRVEGEYEKIKLRMDRMFFGGWNYSVRGNSNEIPSAPSSAPVPLIDRSKNLDNVPSDPDVLSTDVHFTEEDHVANVDKGGMRRVNSYSVAHDSVLGSLSSNAGDASMKEMKEIRDKLSKMTLEKVKAEEELALLKNETKTINEDLLSDIKALTEERDNLKDEVLNLKSDLSRLRSKNGSREREGAIGCDSIDSSLGSSPRNSDHTFKQNDNTINFNNKNCINQSKRTSATSTDPTDDNEQNEIDRSETDTDSLLTIIAMLRATVDQSTHEKEVLEQRLIEEQERAQQEIRSFAATLEGVEDLRRSAEVMSRELRKIKVKGYKPRGSDFLTGRSYEDLTAVDEADKDMVNALRAVERHGLCGEASDSRGVVSSGRASSLLTSETGSDCDEKKPRFSVFQTLKSAIADNLVSESLDIESRTEKKGVVEEYDDYEDDECDEGPLSEEKKKKKKSKKKKNKTDRSVLTSFF
ncbi:hypothetical protein ACHAXS_005258 [Conticribra weissflogii]